MQFSTVQAVLQARKAAGKRGQGFRVQAAAGHIVQHLLQRLGGLAVEGARFRLVLFANAHRVHDDEALLGLCARRHALQLARRDHAHAAALHLLEEAGGLHVAQEEDAFDGLHVRASGDHVHGDGDARREAGAEVGQQVFRREFRRAFPLDGFGFRAIWVLHHCGHFREAGAIGDLLAELVVFGEHFAGQAHDVFGVGVVLGEDERLRHFVAAGKRGGQHALPKLAQHGANLAFGHDVPIHLVGGVGEVVLQPFQAFPPRQFVALGHVHILRARVYRGAFLCDAGFDAVHVEVHVHAVEHGLVVAVLHHQILVEETQRLAHRRGGEADQEGVEVEQHLAPQVVDGAVTFVDDDEVEEFRRNRRVVRHRWRLALPRRAVESRILLVAGVVVRLAFQHREQSLDGRHHHLRRGVDGVVA